MLKEVVVVWILNCTASAHTKVCSWCVIVSLISLLIKLLNHVLLLHSIIREVIIWILVNIVSLCISCPRCNSPRSRNLNLLLIILVLLTTIKAYCIVFCLFNRYLAQYLGFKLPSLISDRLSLIPLCFQLGSFARWINLEPFILKYVISSWPIIGISVQHARQNIDKRIGHTLIVEDKGPSLNTTIEFFICLSSEREATIHQSIQKDSWGPDVSWRSRILFFENYFRCHIGRCSAEHFDLFIIWNACREPEVD